MAVTALERALSRVCPVELPQAHACATTLLPEPPASGRSRSTTGYPSSSLSCGLG
jgi:hypothetical protein